MKTKLLRKVRKEFYILEVTKTSDPDYLVYKFTTPFYLVRKVSGSSCTEWVRETYDGAFNKLVKVIRKKYAKRVKGNNKNKTKKVWPK